MTDFRQQITAALKDFETYPFPEAATRLFATLGYRSGRTLPIASVADFCREWDQDHILTPREREALDQLTSLHFLFQLTDTELTMQRELLDNVTAVDGTCIHSYLFFAAELPSDLYTRTFLSSIARAINKPLVMPALVLIRHGDSVSLAIIHRRLNKRQADRDVLEKATLIKDVHFSDPTRAHVEILNDFVVANLDADYGVSNFVRLHEAWRERLGAYVLSNKFYHEIADWYFWAHHQVDDGTIRLPQHCDTEQDKSLILIRLRSCPRSSRRPASLLHRPRLFHAEADGPPPSCRTRWRPTSVMGSLFCHLGLSALARHCGWSRGIFSAAEVARQLGVTTSAISRAVRRPGGE
jgi:hypothetical protein